MENIEEFFKKENFNWARDVLERHDQNRTALMLMDERENVFKIKYSKLLKMARKYANFLNNEGIKKNDTILILTKLIPDLWYISVSSIYSGIVYSPAPVLLSKNDLRYRIMETGARAIFTDSDSFNLVSQAVKGIYTKVFDVTDENFKNKIMLESDEYDGINSDPNADQVIFFTSGTEGLPKMIVHDGYYPIGHLSTTKWLNIDRNDIHWNISSPGWAKWAWSSFYAPFNVGATVFAFEQKRFSAERALKALENYPITSICAPPTVWRMFLVQDLSNFKPMALKKASSAGEPLNPEIISKWEKITGVRIRDGYGQTETTAMVGNIDSEKIKPGSAGKPLLQYDIKIVDDLGNILPPNAEGHIAVRLKSRTPGLFKGYRNDPKLNDDRFKNGFYFTGDLGKMDEDGYIWFVSRADDVIKASDYRIGPFEVESALLTHPAVAESAVVPSPDPIRGNIVKAYVVLKHGYEPGEELARELSFHVREITAPYKRPKKIEFVKELPKTISGKIIRKELRKREIEMQNVKKENEFFIP